MKLNIQHLLRKIEDKDANAQQLAQQSLPSIIEQIDALARMANEFARFAKLPEPRLEKLELNSFIAQTITHFDKERSLILFDMLQKEVWIMADKDMLNQVFHNLLLNAQQAMDPKKTPQIEVLIRVNRQVVEIEIKDNGMGISSDQQTRIFTPYFTTKSSGSGIGLSVVRQIIEKHNGSIRFESEAQRGTSFFIELKMLSERR
jgi:nitrogen fixation/metabolism regulation signal transduction histidine kinase